VWGVGKNIDRVVEGSRDDGTYLWVEKLKKRNRKGDCEEKYKSKGGSKGCTVFYLSFCEVGSIKFFHRLVIT